MLAVKNWRSSQISFPLVVASDRRRPPSNYGVPSQAGDARNRKDEKRPKQTAYVKPSVLCRYVNVRDDNLCFSDDKKQHRTYP